MIKTPRPIARKPVTEHNILGIADTVMLSGTLLEAVSSDRPVILTVSVLMTTQQTALQKRYMVPLKLLACPLIGFYREQICSRGRSNTSVPPSAANEKRLAVGTEQSASRGLAHTKDSALVPTALMGAQT